MKTIKKEIITTVEKYIAEDGTEFTDALAYLKYENIAALKKLEEKLPSVKAAEGLHAIAEGEVCEDHHYRWYKPLTEEDIEILNETYEDIVDETCIEKYVCVETDCEEELVWSETFDEGIEFVTNLCKALGYDIEIKPKEK